MLVTARDSVLKSANLRVNVNVNVDVKGGDAILAGARMAFGINLA